MEVSFEVFPQLTGFGEAVFGYLRLKRGDDFFGYVNTEVSLNQHGFKVFPGVYVDFRCAEEVADAAKSHFSSAVEAADPLAE